MIVIEHFDWTKAKDDCHFVEIDDDRIVEVGRDERGMFVLVFSNGTAVETLALTPEGAMALFSCLGAALEDE